jgi:2,4-dienoyl-CoA reductase-like NADH-dependent reductase (Old Yellow Enzyme family)
MMETVMAGREDSIAFQTGEIGGMKLKNRLVRSATFEAMATNDGKVTNIQVELYRTLAEGGVGLIITGHAAVHLRWSAGRHMTRISDDSFIPLVRRITRAVHEVGNNCRVVLQLTHFGRQCGIQCLKPLVEPVAPSAVYDTLFKRTPRELTSEEIDEIIECFSQAIHRARQAEFDGVQLHAAHGYLLSSFLSPHTNRREDQYGGSTQGRAMIMKEIYERATRKVGDDFPILVKINSDDFFPGGIDANEATRIAKELARIGYTAIEISGGTWEAITRSKEELGWKPVLLPESRVGIKTKEQEAYFWEAAKRIKKKVAIPVILVGGIKSIDKIEEILKEGSVDFCAMARPLIREPDLPNRWLQGMGSKTAKCKSCNACIPIDEPLKCKGN